MTKTEKQLMTNKWLLVVDHYEKIKQKSNSSFTTVNDLCEAFQINRKDIRKYYERWAKAGKDPEALMPKKRGPKPGQLKILSKEEERIIVKIHRRLNANEFEIYHMIEGYFNVHPSVSTIYRTLKLYPLNEKRKKAIKRYEKKYPGELLHADTYSLPKTLVDTRKQYYLLGLIDDCTRLCHTELIERNTAADVSMATSKALKWFTVHGILPEVIMTDNGSEFTAFTSQKAKETHFFETTLKIFHIKHIYTRPYRPQTNGKIERFWRILNNECILCQNKTITKDELLAELDGYMYRYNYQRRHTALDYKTPLDKLKNIVNLLPKL
ncbi:MAG: transposase [Alphaproteobacteria bacterium]|nr:MAG: transposase [Alphaproteobacteria bacterium]